MLKDMDFQIKDLWTSLSSYMPGFLKFNFPQKTLSPNNMFNVPWLHMKISTGTLKQNTFCWNDLPTDGEFL